MLQMRPGKVFVINRSLGILHHHAIIPTLVGPHHHFRIIKCLPDRKTQTKIFLYVTHAINLDITQRFVRKKDCLNEEECPKDLIEACVVEFEQEDEEERELLLHPLNNLKI